MPETRSQSREAIARASRRRFFQLVAGSPLLALAYPALAADWRSALAGDAAHQATHRALPARSICPLCGGPMTLQQAQAPALPGAAALDDQFGGQLVESADEAINVWDFERVAHANTLPEHWAYIHMGVDDFETRVANREGFQRLVLRPRRLGPDAGEAGYVGRRCSAGDGTRRCSCARSRRSRRTTPRARAARRRAARASGILQIQSHQSSQSYEQIAEARGEPHWFQLYANADWDINGTHDQEGRRAGCPVAGVDHRPARRQQPRAVPPGARAARATTGRSARAATTTSRATSGRCIAASAARRDRGRRSTGTTSSASRTPRR